MEDQMSLRLQSVSIDRQAKLQRGLVSLSSSKGESINVQVPLDPDYNIDELTLHEIEKLALDEAKKSLFTGDVACGLHSFRHLMTE
jgi:hypothetical protein